jgi:hypothetical protein
VQLPNWLQAFKNYDEAGAVRRIQCLKYLVLATMLNQSDVDPFDAQVWTAWPAESHCRCCRGAKHTSAPFVC